MDATRTLGEMISPEIIDGRSQPKVVLYTLSNCTPCKKTIRLLENNNIEFECIEVDTASPEEREGALTIFEDDLPASGRRIAFPIIVIDNDIVITGFDESKIRSSLGI